MAASLTAVRAWSSEKRTKVLPHAFLILRDGLAKSFPNLTNSVDQVEMAEVITALEESVAEDSILEEAVITQAASDAAVQLVQDDLDALQITYDAYVLAHP